MKKMVLFLVFTTVLCYGTALVLLACSEEPLFSGGNSLRIAWNNTNENNGPSGNFSSTREIAAEGVRRIEITAVSSDLKVLTGNTGKFDVSFYGRTSIASSNMPELVVERSGDLLKIRVEWKNHNHKGNFQGHLDVTIPEVLPDAFALNTVSGNIETGDLNGKTISIKTVSGKINIAAAECNDFHVSSTSGDLEIDRITCEKFIRESVSGDMHCEKLTAENVTDSTTSGNCTVEELSGEFAFNSVSGDLSVRYMGNTEKIRVTTTSGDVKITLPGEAGFKADLTTTSGDIGCDFPLHDLQKSKRKLEGTVNDGAGSVSVKTLSGDIRIGK